MYKIIVAILISAFLFNAALTVKADMTNKVASRCAVIDRASGY
jgi:hypothetical protein